MREIKVRVWDKSRKRWVKRVVLVVETDGGISGVIERGTAESHGMDEIDLVWYTGMKDRNGRDIFDGDLLKEYGQAGYTINKVGFGIGDISGWGVDYVQSYDPDGTPRDGRFSRYLDLDWIAQDSEVIGNVYQDHHLLEVFSQTGSTDNGQLSDRPGNKVSPG